MFKSAGKLAHLGRPLDLVGPSKLPRHKGRLKKKPLDPNIGNRAFKAQTKAIPQISKTQERKSNKKFPQGRDAPKLLQEWRMDVATKQYVAIFRETQDDYCNSSTKPAEPSPTTNPCPKCGKPLVAGVARCWAAGCSYVHKKRKKIRHRGEMPDSYEAFRGEA